MTALFLIWRFTEYFNKDYDKVISSLCVGDIKLPTIYHNADKLKYGEKRLILFERDIGKMYVKIGEIEFEALKKIELFSDGRVYLDDKKVNKRIKL